MNTKLVRSLAFITSFVFILTLTFGAFSVFADEVGGSDATQGPFITNPLGNKASNIYQLVKLVVVDILIPLGMILIVLMIIFAGFQFVMAQGNPTKLEDAKKTLFNAIIGASIILGAWAIATIIETTINQIKG